MNTATATRTSHSDYTSPAGNDYHGRIYKAEWVKLCKMKAPPCAKDVYSALTFFSNRDRKSAVVFASDKAIVALCFLARRSLYKGLEWLEEHGVIYRFKVRGRRHIKWGPRPPELVKPQADHPAQIEMNASPPRPAETVPPTLPPKNLCLKLVPKKPQEKPVMQSDEPNTNTAIPKYAGDHTIPPQGIKGLDDIEYAMRIEILQATGWHMDTPAGISDRIHFSPTVTAAWMQAYVDALPARPDINSPPALFDHHLKKRRKGVNGIRLEPGELAHGERIVALRREKLEAASKGFTLVPIDAEVAMRRNDAAAAAKAAIPKPAAKQAFADLRRKMGMAPK